MSAAAAAAAAEEKAASFLQEHLRFESNGSHNRPHVTLTFAQSQDGKIAGPGKTQLALSGAESMLMTHTLRTMHDGIMVGIGTLLNDNPQLNARLLSNPPPVAQLPRPIVLDSNLRTPLDCKLVRNFASGIGRQPLVLASSAASSNNGARLQAAGVEVIQLSDHAAKGDPLDWANVLEQIHGAGVRRLMVEGGAAVIDSLMQQPHLIDALIVTIAPVTIGETGFGFSCKLPDANGLQAGFGVNWTAPTRSQFGKDEVVIWHRR